MKCHGCEVETPDGFITCSSCRADLAGFYSSEILASSGFVGRKRELQELRLALDEVMEGQSRVVMLAGEPGIGKTRLAQELSTYAETQGAEVLWGRCYEGEGAPPYWPWVQPLKSYLERTSPEELQADLGSRDSDVGELLPELRDKLPHLESPPDLEPEQARFRLFNAVTVFLRNVSKRKPLVVVLDDLHWADRSSLLLLQFLCQQLGDSAVLVMGTYRDVEVTPQHPLSETLGRLSREPMYRRQFLGGLSREDLGHFIEITTGIRPSQRLIDAVYGRTEGNPFFTAEVVRLLDQRGELKGEDEPGPRSTAMPAGVLEVIGQRLAGLSALCHQTLTTAAVIGREFDFPLLSLASEGISEDQLLDVIDEALKAHLIEELAVRAECYQFCHALIQETLSAELSSSRKVRQHSRIAQAMEELYRADIEAHAVELAFHFGEAQTLLGPVKLVQYSLMAGERALAGYAWAEAEALFKKGLMARDINLNGAASASDKEAADLMFGLVRAQAATNGVYQLEEPFAILCRAFEYYAEAGEVARAVAVAEFPINPTGRFPGIANLMARALSLVPVDSHEAGRLLSRHGAILGLTESDYEGAQQALGRALSIARREGDLLLEVQTSTYAADVDGQHLHWQESVRHGLRAIALATGNESDHSRVLSHWWASISLLHLGNLEKARPYALSLRDISDRQSTPRSLASIGYVPIIGLACLEGEWEAAREYSDQGLKFGPSYQQILGPRVLLEYETGEFAQGEAHLERLLETTRLNPTPFFSLAKTPMALIEVARITGDPTHLGVAEGTAKAILSHSTITPITAMYAMASLALLAVQGCDPNLAAEHYAYFLEHRGTMIWTLSSADRLLGLLSYTVGNIDQALAHFEDALAFCRKAGYRPELAWTCHDYADTLLQRSDPGDCQEAVSLLEEALTISTELGMRPLNERVVALQEQAWSQPVKAPTYPDGLTRREVEVLRLIATGKTDREIAEELIISARTVTTHVSNILNKTNTANRVEAATYATRQGIA